MDKKQNKITISDVASIAGVSKTTISRYLNGRFEFMSEQSKERIAKVIEELHYRPNSIARSLKSNRSRLLGVIISNISNPFSAVLIKSISDVSRKYNYRVIIANTDDDPKKEQEYVMSMIDQQVEGIILNTTGEINEFLKSIALQGTPIVLAERPTEPVMFDTIRSNDSQVLIKTLEHLQERGYQDVAFFTYSIGKNGTRAIRQQTYRDNVGRTIGCQAQEFIIDVNNLKSGIKAVKKFLNSNPGSKKAIFAVNGMAILDVFKAIRELGLACPEDVGICGFDDWEWMSLVDNGITAIAQSSYKVGTECVKRIMYRIHKNKHAAPKLIELECKLIIRGST